MFSSGMEVSPSCGLRVEDSPALEDGRHDCDGPEPVLVDHLVVDVGRGVVPQDRLVEPVLQIDARAEWDSLIE